METEDYINELAHQCAYDLSHDWMKEVPDWEDVKEAYRRGMMNSDFIKNLWHSNQEVPVQSERILYIRRGYGPSISRFIETTMTGNESFWKMINGELVPSDQVDRWCYYNALIF